PPPTLFPYTTLFRSSHPELASPPPKPTLYSTFFLSPPRRLHAQSAEPCLRRLPDPPTTGRGARSVPARQAGSLTRTRKCRSGGRSEEHTSELQSLAY